MLKIAADLRFNTFQCVDQGNSRFLVPRLSPEQKSAYRRQGVQTAEGRGTIVLTDSYIRGVKGSGDKRLEISDDRCAGLRLRVSEGGVRFRVGPLGWRQDAQAVTLGRHPALTLAEARRLPTSIAPAPPRARRHNPEATSARGSDLHSLRRYVKKIARDKRSWETDSYLLRAARAAWGSRPARRDHPGATSSACSTTSRSARGRSRTEHKASCGRCWAGQPARNTFRQTASRRAEARRA